MRTEISDAKTSRARHAVASIRIFGSGDMAIFAGLSALRIAAVGWFLLHWLSPLGWWSKDKLSFVGATLLVLIGLAGNHLRWFALPLMKQPLPTEPGAGLRVAAVTTCVPDLEPLEMLESTLKALVSLDYPHDTWLLDEGDSAIIHGLCRRLGVQHFSRHGRPFYQTENGRFARRSKHGNYNAWLHEIGFETYDVLIAFDPDHVPLPQFANSVLGFFEDPQVAYVQAPQVYRNQSSSWIARGAAEETYAYYSATEMASYGIGEPVLTGCHSTHRLSALRGFGGFPDHTAEDLLQTVYYRTQGWHGIYVPRVLATGLAPEGWPEYLVQQIRWARSVLDIKFRRLRGLRGSSRKSWLELLQGFGYLQDGVLAGGALMLLIPLLAVGIGQPTYDHLASPAVASLIGVLFVSDLFRQRFYLQPRREAGIHWRAGILRLAKWPFVWNAFWLVVRNKPFAYVVTPKTRTTRAGRMLLLPHGLIAAIVTAAWMAGELSGNIHRQSLHLVAAAIVALSIGLIWSETPRKHGHT